MAAAGQDKTVNKVAVCSAIFAGLGFVGYSVVRTALHRRRREYDVSYPEGEARLYFRKLSQTTQTDSLLGNMDVSKGGRVILRPLSVQERIRELNFRARHFADTMLALQGHPRATSNSVGPRSLQCSPWSSPRILSPVDIRHFIASRSSDNLSLVNQRSEGQSPVRRRWSRKSMGKRSPDPDAEINSDEADRAIADSEALKEKLEALSLKGRAMDPYEAKTLVALLSAPDEGVLERALVTLANLATLDINQHRLREGGCLHRLQNLLSHPKDEIRLATVRALGNLALNEENQKEMKGVIPILVSFLSARSREEDGEEISEAVLTTLANVAVLTNYHHEFFTYLDLLYGLIDVESVALQLQTLKLLVNLSTNPEMVPSLLGAKAPQRLFYLLCKDAVCDGDYEVLLRLVTFLANIVTTAKREKVKHGDLPHTQKAASPDTLYASVYGVNKSEKLKERSEQLMNHHSHQDIRIQARRLHSGLSTP